MTNALSIFEQPQISVPAHVASFLGTNTNIDDRVTVPSLSFEGKVWSINVNGEKTKLMKRDADGDELPVGVMRVVVLAYNKRRGRAYYEGTYDPAKVGAPVCWSDDGITPDATIQEPVHSKCEGCPMSIKGSRVNDSGKPTVACSQHRMLAVVPAHKLDFEPLRMKIAVTSDWDKNSPELEAAGWFAFNNFTDYIKTRGIAHTAAIVTKMKFDPNVAYPKIVFSPERWLNEEELAVIAPVAQSDKVKSLISGTWTPAGSDGVQKTAAISAPATGVVDDGAAQKASDAAIAAAAAEKAAKDAAAAAAKQAKAEAKAKADAAAAAKAEQEAAAAEQPKATTMIMPNDDDDAGTIIEHKAAPAAKAEEKAAPAITADVSSLLAEWGDD